MSVLSDPMPPRLTKHTIILAYDHLRFGNNGYFDGPGKRVGTQWNIGPA